MVKKRHWLKGDCHLHTCNSDGKFTPEELYDKLFEKGIDFAFITDHNVNTPGRNAFNYRGIAIFPGMEISGGLGHVNVWGENLPFERISRPADPEGYYTLIERVREAGCHVSVNHPFDRKLTWKIDRDEFLTDSVEVWNSPMHTDNIYCMQWWTDKLMKGQFIPAVGGSDYHEDYVVTDLLCCPTTYVYAESNSIDDVLSAIKRGNVFVTNSPKASRIFLTSGECVPGDRMEYKEGAVAEIAVDRLKKGHTLRVYHNENIIFEYTAKRDWTDFSQCVEVPSAGFVRADVKYTLPDVAKKVYAKAAGELFGVHDKGEEVPDFVYSFTNPIFFD